ncbi:unnamed protein product [Albugo candida]|uniref:Uncharacterized protein n=1 Tax=Albugo candida TaxID=65357 RepID=A0A024GVQ5_9STRA|nr:unnamed protein product [Albugo candida]|eukprot:CCI50769.1 unnamed protein product [Albugo candida]
MGRQRVRLHYDTKDDDVAPFLATFRGGPLPPTEDLSKFGFQMYQHVNKKQRLVVASTDRVAYQAANFGYMSNLNDSANYVLGVFDKTTKSVRLIDVPQVYVMQQTIKNINDQQDSEDETEDLQKTKETREKRRQELVDKFGSKKSQRIVKSRMENRLQAENVSGGQAIASTLHMRIQEAEQKAPTALNANQLNALLPPCNMDATVPEKVYALSNILDHANIESLKVKAHEYEKVLSSNIASGINSERFGIFATRDSYTIQHYIDSIN